MRSETLAICDVRDFIFKRLHKANKQHRVLAADAGNVINVAAHGGSIGGCDAGIAKSDIPARPISSSIYIFTEIS